MRKIYGSEKFFSFLFNLFLNLKALISKIKKPEIYFSKKFLLFSASIIVFNSGNIFAITELSKEEMKKKVAASGISIGIKGAVFYHDNSSIKLIDTQDSDQAYINFHNIKRLSTYTTGDIDLDSNGYTNHLEIDIINPQDPGSSYDNPFVSIKCDDWGSRNYINIEEINFNGYKIGSLDIRESSTPKWNLSLGAHNSGIDMEAGLKSKIPQLSFNYGNPSDSYYLGFTSFFLAKNFPGSAAFPDDPSNPSTWNANGKFKVGDFQQNNPATIDIGVRVSDNSPVISISAPMSGSVRMGNIHIKDKDFGPAAIDGIIVHTMSIEIPGRDLGDI